MTAKAIMIQGTGSGVGKSLLACALCRIFHQDGYRVAPFKAQNMALNSYVTQKGGEMGRAQVAQAEASGIPPEVEMNPILLKPNADSGSQVIVMGRPIGNMTAKEYYDTKYDWLEIIKKAYEDLRDRFDIIVIEGAGSPAEINLKNRDIVNMKMAELADAPVIMVTDVDRGGAFAWIVGTLELLLEEERKRLCGFVFNKFRGDPELIRPGLEMLQRRTGLPVLGMVPYLRDVNLDEEDSASLDAKEEKSVSDVDIAIIKLPRISNFTDFNILSREHGVSVRYVENPRALGQPDLIILPGTKSTISDLLFLRQSGLAQALISRADDNTTIIGICGGFQMLGKHLRDEDHVESNNTFMQGLGLLDTTTTFLPWKHTYQVKAVVEDGTLPFYVEGALSGYEIHMGNSSPANSPFLRIIERSGQPVDIMDGAISPDRRVIGTYLHGLFDNDAFRLKLLDYLRYKKGRPPLSRGTALSFSASKEMTYNRLAEVVRKHLRIDLIYNALKLSKGRQEGCQRPSPFR